MQQNQRHGPFFILHFLLPRQYLYFTHDATGLRLASSRDEEQHTFFFSSTFEHITWLKQQYVEIGLFFWSIWWCHILR